MSVDQLKGLASAKLGFARTNQFLVELPSEFASGGLLATLTSLVTSGSMGGGDLNLLCASATLPGKQVLVQERRIGMEYQKVANGYAVDDVSLTFLLTNDYYVKRYFDRWKDFIINEDRQIANYKNSYQAKVVIHQLSNSIPRTAFDIQIGSLPIGIDVTNFLNSLTAKSGINVGKSVYSVELIDAFPTTISAIEFNNQPDAFVELSIQMSYTNFKRINNSQISFKL